MLLKTVLTDTKQIENAFKPLNGHPLVYVLPNQVTICITEQQFRALLHLYLFFLPIKFFSFFFEMKEDSMYTITMQQKI